MFFIPKKAILKEKSQPHRESRTIFRRYYAEYLGEIRRLPWQIMRYFEVADFLRHNVGIMLDL